MKLSAVIAGLLGLALATLLVAYVGFGPVVSSLAAVGPGGFLLFTLYSFPILAVLGAAWWMLSAGEPARRMLNFAWARQVREAAADVLPVSPLGGLVVGARALTLGGVAPAQAYASLAVDLVAEMIAQLVFVLVGVVLLIGRLSRATLASDPLIVPVILGLGLMVAGAVAFIAVQRGGMGRLTRLAERFLPSAAVHVQGVDQRMALIYRRPARLAAGVALHLTGWVGAALGVWIGLRFMGVDLPILAVVALESLISAVKGAAFMAPYAVGVQEGGYAVLGPLFGLAPEMAIALSLLKRAREFAIGVPTLLVWQGLEGRRLLRPPPSQTPVVAPAPVAAAQD